jgi:hypothetical protein
MQIRAKLTLTYFIISFILLISSLLFIYYSFRNYIYTEFYDTLRSKALMTVMMVEKSNPDLTLKMTINHQKLPYQKPKTSSFMTYPSRNCFQ